MTFTRTKVLCTVGPSTSNKETLIEFVNAGMSGARINFSHGTYEQHQHTIDNLKEVRQRLEKPLAILLDTCGPEMRVSSVCGEVMSVVKGQRVKLVGEERDGEEAYVAISPKEVLGDIQQGMRILFKDGYISSRVVEISSQGIVLEMENDGEIKARDGVNIPNADLGLPAMTEKDKEDIRFGCKNDVDIIAASFIRSPEHVIAIKKLLIEEGKNDILIIAKIENTQGVRNFDSILQVADGIMIARGDLGVEMPLSQVPRLQKMMIRKCYQAGKPAITATQMLESMIHNPRPTRAEASDVANAIYDSTSVVMLSGETAVGKYPLRSIEVMKSVLEETEKDFNYRSFFKVNSSKVYNDVPSSVTLASVKTAYSSSAQAIFAFTKSGTTARLLSRLRPEMPIIAFTTEEKCYHQMALNWGVIPVLDKKWHMTEREAFQAISDHALEKGYVHYGDLVVMTAGTPFGVAGTTNMMIVENIGDVLVRAYCGVGGRVSGEVALLFSADVRNPYEVEGKIVVITKCNDAYLPFLKNCKGVILENHMEDIASEQYVLLVAKTLDIPAVVRSESSLKLLKEGQLVTVDPQQALVFNGIVKG
jgi:pyruvate kinase